MKILVINAGSSSLKYQLIDMDNLGVLAKGNCERIGISGGIFSHKTSAGFALNENCAFPDHTAAFNRVVKALLDPDKGVIRSMDEISAVGHRIVQGAEFFTQSVEVTDDVLAKIEQIADLAPLHNRAHAQAIRACRAVLEPSVLQVVVFDTSFHQTMPQKAYMFGVPYEYYEKYHIRRYGFHGTSHRYVSAQVARLVGGKRADFKTITCHLGNGSSIAAVEHGKVIDTTMGLTPLDGFIMGTRSGTLDPSVVTYIMEKENLTPRQMDDLLNKKSGYLGISGLTSDRRDLAAAAEGGHERAKLALDMQHYQIKKFIGAFIAAMNGVDLLVFTGGIGENAADARREICRDMTALGIAIDEDKNQALNGKEGEITAPGAAVRTFIVPTNEELTIARDTLAIYNEMRGIAADEQ